MKHSRRLPLLGLLALVPFLSAAQPAQDLSIITTAVLRARISGSAPALHLDAAAWRAAEPLACFYERRSFAPAWSDARGLLPAADELLAALAAAGDDGLRPEDYRAEALLRSLQPVRQRPTPGDLAEADLLLTDAFLRFAEHLRHGKVNPNALYSDCSLAADEADLADLLEKTLAAGRIRPALGELAPPHPEYRRLRDALRRYRIVATAAARDPRVETLRERLAADARADGAAAIEPPEGAPEIVDPPLEQAIRAFQERHGLTPDGIAGPATLGEINQSPADHVRQIAVNLERWRWMPRDLGVRHVLVNIAGFRLEAVENGRRALDMRVIVGKPYTRTPMFSSRMTAVAFNPSWYVPTSIATKELYPKARRDPSYFRRNGYQVLTGGRIRQVPGAGNALGRIKFLFPNRFGVYLHDTPSHSLFGQTVRTFSHGCIRIEKPLEMAAWVLGNDSKWTPEAIEAAIATGRERTIPLPDPIAVHVAYWTAWVDDAGVLQVGRDVYGRDAELGKRLGF
jgi:murein L,D-transpeptidase YcbB/YkuD